LKIIAFAGMPFSGKSEAVKIAKDRGIPVVRMGDMVWDEVISRRLELSDANVGTIANEMRQTHGKNIWAIKTIEKIKTMDPLGVLIIDGIRNVEEIEVFKKELGQNFVVVAITVSDEIRHQRAMNRNREDDSKDLSLIKERDKRELGWGLGRVIESADITISNDTGIEDFRKEINKKLDKI
jgi:dephospho-CoA kinase